MALRKGALGMMAAAGAIAMMGAVGIVSQPSPSTKVITDPSADALQPLATAKQRAAVARGDVSESKMRWRLDPYRYRPSPKYRAPGERAHLRWRKRRAQGRGAQ